MNERKRRRLEMRRKNSRQTQDNNVTFVLIVVVLVFIICQTPALVTQISSFTLILPSTQATPSFHRNSTWSCTWLSSVSHKSLAFLYRPRDAAHWNFVYLLPLWRRSCGACCPMNSDCVAVSSSTSVNWPTFWSSPTRR